MLSIYFCNMRKKIIYKITDVEKCKQQLLYWSRQFTQAAVLDSNNAAQKVNSKPEYNSFEFLMAADAAEELTPEVNGFDALQQAVKRTGDWWFGYLTYDLKNELEDLQSNNFDGLQFAKMHFFRPKLVFLIQDDELIIHYLETEFEKADIENLKNAVFAVKPLLKPQNPVTVQARISKEEYLNAVRALKEHIRKGDIYEVNFCQEFFAGQADIYPEQLYDHLKNLSPTPYGCFYKTGNHYLLSASPERFMKKKGMKLISQPIKGTAKRGKDRQEDEAVKHHLFTDAKERAENIMIVDLVRNDLSHTAVKGSVRVEELCGIYSFPQVHQMISTVTAELREDVHFVEAVKQCFPMGSMTGAPKIRAMKLIEQYESSKRGLYSGAVGYITPGGDFDFNVVIRSILYNAANKYLSFMVGGAITMQADPEKEYEECLLKAKAIRETLKSGN